MADTYTAAAKARKIEEGTRTDTWGPVLNEALEEIDDMASGVSAINLGTSTTYAMAALSSGSDSESRASCLRFTGTPASAVTVTVPASVVDKKYRVENSTGQRLTIKYASGTGVVLGNLDKCDVWCDGSEIYDRGPGSRITAAEIAASVTPVNYTYPPGNVLRYGTNTTPETTDMITAINNAINVCKRGTGITFYMPKGGYRVTGPLDLSGMFFTNQLRLRGDGEYHSYIYADFDSSTTAVLDLSGSVLCDLEGFSIRTAPGKTPGIGVLCARLASNNSAGNHRFSNFFVRGTYACAPVVIWGSEENQYYSCWFMSDANTPALVVAIKISEAGFTPTSPFQTLGTGEGGVGFQSFYGCRITNETGTAQTVPVAKLYGTLGTLFSNGYFAGFGPTTVEVSHSAYPSDPTDAYPAVVTFDTCSDEIAGTAAAWSGATAYVVNNLVTSGGQVFYCVQNHTNQVPPNLTYWRKKETIRVPTPTVAGKAAAKGLKVSNCQFADIYGADGSLIDGLNMDGGKYSNSMPVPSGSKLSAYNLTNATIAVSKEERALTYLVRNSGSGNRAFGIDPGKAALGSGYQLLDSAGGISSNSATAGVGYADGAGGTVTQITSDTTSVTLDKLTGMVQTVSQTLAAGASAAFTVNCSAYTVLDNVDAMVVSYGGAGDPFVKVKGISNGVFQLKVINEHAATALNAVVQIQFTIHRGQRS